MTDHTSDSNEKINTPPTVPISLGCGAAGLILSGVVGLVLGGVAGIGLFVILAMGLSGTPDPEEWSQILFIGGMIGVPLGLVTAVLCGLGGAVLGVIGGAFLGQRRYHSG